HHTITMSWRTGSKMFAEARTSLRVADQFMRRHLHGLAHPGHGRATISAIHPTQFVHYTKGLAIGVIANEQRKLKMTSDPQHDATTCSSLCRGSGVCDPTNHRYLEWRKRLGLSRQR